MFRFRRYRYYVFFAAIVVFLLYRVARNSEQWESVSASFPHTAPSPQSKLPPTSQSDTKKQSQFPVKDLTSEDDDLPQRILDKSGKDNAPVQLPDLKNAVEDDHDDGADVPQRFPEKSGKGNYPVQIPDSKGAADAENGYGEDGNDKKATDEDGPELDLSQPDTDTEEAGVVAYDHDEASKATTGPGVNMPDKSVGKGAKDTDQNRWRKLPEHFPVPKSEIIPLPTDKPKKIPAIQYAFGKESSKNQELREARQQQVKAEMERGWAGYWKYARGHDELSPVSKKFRDPFCGWAATLVDSLDTLWIMGMTEEFEEALSEVEKIDFTVSKKNEIPVFETTIRYLGGLLAAYDVSGGKKGGYNILLTKAQELAEILMGVFDTPNRMPLLYYNWRPQYASQPKRADARAGVAELGSLAMEFTRLAQITKEDKYYDAVARITDAFYDLQERGTSLPGIFPEHIDASGCNHTAQTELEAAKNAAEMELSDETNSNGIYDVEASAGKYNSDQLDLEADVNPKSQQGGYGQAGSHVLKRSRKSTALNLNNVKKTTDSKTGRTQIIAGERALPDCVSQGLTPGGWGAEQYSMGGSQDSTYEYFPKQWLLLGGLEPKYKELHLKVTEAVKKWLLYRPMVPDDRDIMFSAKVYTSGDPETDARTEYEVTHLTCFIGGMFGMGGKIFEIPADVEIGEKLTEGCVWAYESTTTGIMPEGAQVLPCLDAKDCHWNQTKYEQALDPSFDNRQKALEAYYEQKAKDKEEREKQEKTKAAEAKAAKAKAAKAKATKAKAAKEKEAKAKAAMEKAAKEEMEESSFAQDVDSSASELRQPKEFALDEDPSTNELRQPKKSTIGGWPSGDTHADHENTHIRKRAPVGVARIGDLEDTEDIEDSDPASASQESTTGQLPLKVDNDDSEDDPLRPLTHKEYVAHKIKSEQLPKGFVNVNSKAYILRPEAIESVWYMYRITGDKKWQDKGWKMFEAIVRYTTTDVGNSAIDNVLSPKPRQNNEMESFWTAETLKYFYLLYSEPSLISLDDWVLNTEAHPFRRPKASFGV